MTRLVYSSDRHSPVNTERWLLQLGKTMLRYANRGYGSKSAAMTRINTSRARLSRLCREYRGLPVAYQEMPHFETRIGGIPCGIRVTHYLPASDWVQHKGAGCGPGDCEPPAHEDIEYQVLDRRGYPADWISVDRDDHLRILEMIRRGSCDI